MDSFLPVTAQDYKSVLDCKSKIIKTRLGDVECAIYGEGPAILAVHGGGAGGFLSGLAMSECFIKNGFQIIAPSRPGYFRTSLERGVTLEQQADLLVALLDALKIDSIAVLGASAGGPPSYLMAHYYPKRVSALIEIDSCSLHYTKGQEITKLQQKIFLSQPGLWLTNFFAKYFPAATVKSFLKAESTLGKHELKQRVKNIVKDPVKLAFIQTFTKIMSQYSLQKKGTLNDLDRLFEIDKLTLDKIICPTLIIHGDADSDVPLSNAEYAHKSIKGSELKIISKGSHLGFWVSDDAENVQKESVEWLRDHIGK